MHGLVCSLIATKPSWHLLITWVMAVQHMAAPHGLAVSSSVASFHSRCTAWLNAGPGCNTLVGGLRAGAKTRRSQPFAASATTRSQDLKVGQARQVLRCAGVRSQRQVGNV